MPNRYYTNGNRTRRAALATGGTLIAALAGCTRVSEFFVDHYIGEVNIFNTVDRHITGSITLDVPDQQLRLNEQLELAPRSENDDDQEPQTIYGDVLTESGTYQLDLLIEETDITPERSITEHLEIDNPDEEYIVIVIGREYTEEFLTVAVIDDFEELEEMIEA